MIALRSRPRILLAAAVLLCLAGVAVIVLRSRADAPLVRTAQIEMREIDISSKVPGRIAMIAVDEGDTVAAGALLFALGDREVRAREGQALGAAAAAGAQWSMALRGARREQLAMAEEQVAAARSQCQLADRTLRRMQALHADSLISDQEFDAAEQRQRAAQAALQAAEAQRDMARNGARPEEKEAARGQYDRALGSLDEARAYVDETSARSPIPGIIGKRYADAGEIVPAGFPVLTVLDTRDVWAELNLPETELARLRPGDVVTGTIHALGRSARFRVASVAAAADVANWRAQNDRGSFEVRSFTVTLRPEGRIPGLRPGMTVAVELGSGPRP